MTSQNGEEPIRQMKKDSLVIGRKFVVSVKQLNSDQVKI